MLESGEMWQRMWALAREETGVFRKYEMDHEIKKLKLEKIAAEGLPEKMLGPHSVAHNRQPHKNWLENQYRLFIWYVLLLSELTPLHPTKFEQTHWHHISTVFHKPPLTCQYFYLCCLKSKSRPWSKDEDQYISQLMKVQSMQKKWTDIGLDMFQKSNGAWFRKPKTIRERWTSHVNPLVNKSGWDTEEDIILFTKTRQWGKKWSRISQLLVSRSEHSVKNRYHHILNLKTRSIGQTIQSLNAEQELAMVQNYIQQLQQKQNKKNQTESQPVIKKQDIISVKKQEGNQPYCVGYLFHPIILTSLVPL